MLAKMTVIDKLIAEIERARVELAKLESALEICQRLEGEPEPQQPLFTVTKAVTHKPKEPLKPARGETARMIMKLLKISGPQKTNAIIRDTGIKDKTIWNNLHSLLRAGKIVKREDGCYAIAE